MKTQAFTLLETLLALLIFSIAIVALVEAVHQMGDTTIMRRHEAAVQERLRSLLIEHTRSPAVNAETIIREDEVSYTIRRRTLNLDNREGQRLSNLFDVQVIAEWMEGRTRQQAAASTWIYLPLFKPTGT